MMQSPTEASELPNSAKISTTQQVRRAGSDYRLPLWDSVQFRSVSPEYNHTPTEFLLLAGKG